MGCSQSSETKARNYSSSESPPQAQQRQQAKRQCSASAPLVSIGHAKTEAPSAPPAPALQHQQAKRQWLASAPLVSVGNVKMEAPSAPAWLGAGAGSNQGSGAKSMIPTAPDVALATEAKPRARAKAATPATSVLKTAASAVPLALEVKPKTATPGTMFHMMRNPELYSFQQRVDAVEALRATQWEPGTLGHVSTHPQEYSYAERMDAAQLLEAGATLSDAVLVSNAAVCVPQTLPPR